MEYGFHTHGFNLSFEGGLTGYLRGMDSEVKGDANDAIDESTNNAVTTDYFSFYLSQKVEYACRQVEITLRYPFNYTFYKFNQRLANRSEYF